MNKIIIPVLASVLILGFLGTAEDAFAPKKLFVGGLSWDSASQSFVVDLELSRGMFEAVHNSGAVIPVGIFLPTEGLGFTHVYSGDPTQSDNFGKVKVQFHWDRNDGSFEGPIEVIVEAQILNPAGKTVAIAEPKDFEVLVTRDTTPPEVSFVTPSPGASFPVGSTIARAITTDSSGITKIQLFKNGEEVQSVDLPQLPTEIDFEFEFQLFLSDNPVVLQVRAVDAFDNEGFSELLPLQVIPDEPLVEICDNGRDDDGDGLEDCFDSDCAVDPVCGPSDNP